MNRLLAILLLLPWVAGAQVTVTNQGGGTTTFLSPMGGNGVGLTNLQGSNIVFTGVASFASATNTFTLANDSAQIVSDTDVSITNVLGQIAGQYRWGTLWISNSAASAITARYSTAGRKIGSSTTNALSIAAGKLGMFSLECLGTSWTNYASAAEQ